MAEETMETRIKNSLLLRKGIKNETLITDMISDCILELRDHLNYLEEDQLPLSCEGIVKEMVLIKYNRDGTEGEQSESHSGVSVSFLDDLPKPLRRRMNKYRKLPG